MRMIAGAILILAAQVGVVGSHLIPEGGLGGPVFLASLFLGLLGFGLLILGRNDHAAKDS